jgi:integrase
MSIFAAIMNYAISKKYVPASQRFEGMPKLKSARRDEFTLEEYRKLHSVGRKWLKEATTPQGIWYRQTCHLCFGQGQDAQADRAQECW